MHRRRPASAPHPAPHGMVSDFWVRWRLLFLFSALFHVFHSFRSSGLLKESSKEFLRICQGFLKNSLRIPQGILEDSQGFLKEPSRNLKGILTESLKIPRGFLKDSLKNL